MFSPYSTWPPWLLALLMTVLEIYSSQVVCVNDHPWFPSCLCRSLVTAFLLVCTLHLASQRDQLYVLSSSSLDILPMISAPIYYAENTEIWISSTDILHSYVDTQSTAVAFFFFASLSHSGINHIVSNMIWLCFLSGLISCRFSFSIIVQEHQTTLVLWICHTFLLFHVFTQLTFFLRGKFFLALFTLKRFIL